MIRYFRERKRARLHESPTPAHWPERLLDIAPYYKHLPDLLRDELHRHMQVFLAEKHFEGCGGFDLQDDDKLLVTMYACLLLLQREHDYFPLLKSVLIYPDVFIAKHEEEDELGFVDEEEVEQEGESWDLGTVVLSWRDIERDIAQLDGRNVILHEFAHQIYDSGDLSFESADAYDRFRTTIEKHYDVHCKSVDRDRRTFIDPYGAEDPAEYFSVITEAFFEQPHRFENRHPELYSVLRDAYQQDPKQYFPRQ